VYVAKNPGANAHMPGAFMFGDDGMPVTARRSPGSYAAEAATRFADSRLRGAGRDGVGRICRRALGFYGS